MRKTEYKANWAFRIAAVFLCLTLITTHLLSGLYARYSTSASGSDGARVASFQVTESGVQTATISLDDMHPGSGKTYTFKVTNSSEVAVACLVSVTTTGNLPLTFSVAGPDGTAHDLKPGTPVAMAAISHGQTVEAQYTLTVTWPAGQNDAKYAGLLDAVKLFVTAQQVD